MSIAISRIGFASVLAAVTVVACGSGETTQGFGESVESYQSPPVGQENGSQPPNNLLGCSPQSGCQSCETPCDLCECRFEGEQLDENEYLLCLTAPNCVAAIRSYVGAEVGTNYGPDPQFLPTGDQVSVEQGCAQLDDPCTYCLCIDEGNCDAECNQAP